MSTQTISRLLENADEINHTFLRKWCEIVAHKGGTFSIETKWIDQSWMTVYTINWPDGVAAFGGPAQ